MPGVLSRLYQRLEWLFSASNTAQFLKDRNVRATVLASDGRSFYTLPVTPLTQINARSSSVLLRVKLLSDHKLRIRVSRASSRQLLADLTMPFTTEVDRFYLNLDELRLQIDLDAAPSAHTPDKH